MKVTQKEQLKDREQITDAVRNAVDKVCKKTTKALHYE